MRKKYSREIVREGEEIERLLIKKRDIAKSEGETITKEDARKKTTEFAVKLFREHRISEEVYDYLLFGMGIKDTGLALMLADAREMFDKGMNWEEFQEFRQAEQAAGRRLL